MCNFLFSERNPIFHARDMSIPLYPLFYKIFGKGFSFLVLPNILVNVTLVGVKAYDSGLQAYDIVSLRK